MQRAFNLIAGHPALDFANTLDDRYQASGQVERVESYGDLVRFCVQSSLLTGAQAQRLMRHVDARQAEATLGAARELREAIERIFSAVAGARHVAPDDLATLNRHAGRALAHRRIEKRPGSFAWTWEGIADAVSGPLWPIADAATGLLVSDDRQFVRRCECDTCQWLFLDTSKNHSRKWCDMKICGNRTKARTYYRRRRDPAARAARTGPSAPTE